MSDIVVTSLTNVLEAYQALVAEKETLAKENAKLTTKNAKLEAKYSKLKTKHKNLKEEIKNLMCNESDSEEETEQQTPDNCPVCLDHLINDVIELECGHKMHKECDHETLTKCPMCREVREDKDQSKAYVPEYDPVLDDVDVQPVSAFRPVEVENELETRRNHIRLLLRSLNRDINDLVRCKQGSRNFVRRHEDIRQTAHTIREKIAQQSDLGNWFRTEFAEYSGTPDANCGRVRIQRFSDILQCAMHEILNE